MPPERSLTASAEDSVTHPSGGLWRVSTSTCQNQSDEGLYISREEAYWPDQKQPAVRRARTPISVYMFRSYSQM
jgi:hypothetical protein